jgi:dTMP kinase
VFLSLEGIDGSGKSTQARMLAEWLRAGGREVVLTREPGGSPGAEEIRRLLVEGAPGRWSPQVEALLFTAARRDHLERTILPALARGAWVVTDRFADSTRVYQGAARGEAGGGGGDPALVDGLHALAIGREPDLTFVIDLPPEEAHARTRVRGGAETRFEAMGEGLQHRLRAGFLALARRHPGRVRLVDGSGPAEQVQERLRAALGEAVT